MRFLKASDLQWCASVLEDGFEDRPELKAKLPQLWANLMVIDALIMIVIVDDIRHERVAFGAAVVVSDECMEMAYSTAVPNLSVRILERELDRPSHVPSYILRLEDIRGVNHARNGVNLTILHYSESVARRTVDEIRIIRDKAVHAMIEMERGYALKEFTMEFYGEQDLPFITAMGLKIRNDYPLFRRSLGDRLPPQKRPYLGGLNREEVGTVWGSPVSMLFSYSAPVCRFSIAQQRVLLRACRNARDSEIAQDLGVEESTLRDHWRAIFARVENAQHAGDIPLDLLPDFSVSANRSRTTLVPYLKQHPEELRPADPRQLALATVAASKQTS